MSVSNKHILRQGPVIASMGRTAFAALLQQLSKSESAPVATPGPEFKQVVRPLPQDLVQDYVRHVGGDTAAYKTVLPPHLFPQWGFALATQTLLGISYPLAKVMNGGCRIEIHKPLPNNEPLNVSARLEDIDDNGRRAVLHQKIITGTSSAPNALVSHLYAIVPLGNKEKGENRKKSEPPRVPENVRELAFWKIGPKAGLDFAKLTGDFNPIHWIPAYARASGFKNTILHGFGTMARAMEGINRVPCADGKQIKVFDVKFTRPLVLPAQVGLYIDDQQNVFVGDAPGGPAYLVGTYETA